MSKQDDKENARMRQFVPIATAALSALNEGYINHARELALVALNLLAHGPKGKSWDSVYLGHVQRGLDHGYAAHLADEWEKRKESEVDAAIAKVTEGDIE